ncbi:hypothetical protein ACTVZO_00095 [Streptomyces sp. IBSNAI002]|uniref:hypothetical protein n=1 Tax=Streptomyces sp. IBSNAI002 TaxID=3457500 RepID=UPI003FD637C6
MELFANEMGRGGISWRGFEFTQFWHEFYSVQTWNNDLFQPIVQNKAKLKEFILFPNFGRSWPGSDKLILSHLNAIYRILDSAAEVPIADDSSGRAADGLTPDCQICLEPCFADARTVAGCSARDAQDCGLLYHEDCLRKVQILVGSTCLGCYSFQVTKLASANDRPRVPTLLADITAPRFQRDAEAQTGALCYAAAAAAAIRWGGGKTVSMMQCMHAFLFSGMAETSGNDAVADYRAEFMSKYFAETGRQYEYEESPFESPLEKMDGDIVRLATLKLGFPVFPADIPVLHKDIGPNQLRTTLLNGGAIMAPVNGGVHWQVIYGCKVTPPGEVKYVNVFDPAAAQYLTVPWERKDYDGEFFCVGSDVSADG